MDMDFAVSGPLVRRSRLVPDVCPSTRTFAVRFLQTSPRGDSPCVVANPSPPSGWVEDFHLQATEHAQHTTKPLRGKYKVGQAAPGKSQLEAETAAPVRRGAISRRHDGQAACARVPRVRRSRRARAAPDDQPSP